MVSIRGLSAQSCSIYHQSVGGRPVTTRAKLLPYGEPYESVHHSLFFLTFTSGWKQMTGKLHPVWQMAGWHGSMGCPPTTAATEGTDGNKSPPTARITEQAHLKEERPSTRGGWKTLACMRANDDGVKGKTTSHSNQLSALICYFNKVESQQHVNNIVRALLHNSSS